MRRMRGETSLSTFAAICTHAPSIQWAAIPAGNNNKVTKIWEFLRVMRAA